MDEIIKTEAELREEALENSIVINDSEETIDTAVTEKLSVRPLFYLKSDVKITGGTGTSTDPYIIN